MRSLLGRSGRSYDIEDEPMSGGGEASVFRIRGEDLVIKLYTAIDHANEERSENVARLVSLRSTPRLWRPQLEPLCLPTDVIIDGGRMLGYVMPAVPGNLQPLIRWMLPKQQKLHQPSEAGSLAQRAQVLAQISQAASMLELATGMELIDLTGPNVLSRPSKLQCALIDLDSALLKGRRRIVDGTLRYQAPEIVTGHAFGGPRAHLHSFAVMAHWLMLFRHPLVGRAIFDPNPTTNETMQYGTHALWADHPDDDRNRPLGGIIPASALGVHIFDLFRAAFVDGIDLTEHGDGSLVGPALRPPLGEWARSLTFLGDRIVPCPNVDCFWRGFPVQPGLNACPSCGHRSRRGASLPILQFGDGRGRAAPGAVMVGWPDRPLYQHHLDPAIAPDATPNQPPIGSIIRNRKGWFAEVGAQLTPLTPGMCALSGGRGVIVQYLDFPVCLP